MNRHDRKSSSLFFLWNTDDGKTRSWKQQRHSWEMTIEVVHHANQVLLNICEGFTWKNDKNSTSFVHKRHESSLIRLSGLIQSINE